VGNLTEGKFREVTSISQNGWHKISKLPQEVHQTMWRELESYDLDVGDCFIFTCGYEWTNPKEITVVLQITAINRDGTYSYNFHAWQMQ
jgi:hypothetical protein